MTIAEFRTLAEPGLSNIWHSSWPLVETEFDKIANVRDQEKLVITDAKMAGFGGLEAISEGGPVTYKDAITPVTRDYNVVKRGLGYIITEKFQDFELYGQLALFERDLMEVSADDIDNFFFGVLNNATGTGVSTGFDGLALASTAHTRLDGGATQSNSVSTALSVASLQTVRINFNKYVNDRGRPIRIRPVMVVIPPDLENTLDEILDSQLKPDTANNTINVITRYGLGKHVSRYITSTTWWAVMGDSHDVNFFWWKRPTTSSEIEFDTDNIKRKVVQAYGRGHGEWRGYYQGNT
jgi:hypothetical protein